MRHAALVLCSPWPLSHCLDGCPSTSFTANAIAVALIQLEPIWDAHALVDGGLAARSLVGHGGATWDHGTGSRCAGAEPDWGSQWADWGVMQ